MRGSVLAVTVLLGWLAVSTDALAVMSVDLGSEFMKVAIVKPGVPMEIAINKESRRKTAVVVSLRNGERLFSDPALASGVRFPETMYAFFLDLLGKTVDNPAVLKYQERFPYHKIEADPDRNTVVFRHDEETTYTPEELLAMILQHAREIAENFAEQKIADIVVTVPPYYNQAERRAVEHAVELSGLHLLQLMSDNTAVALQYGIFRMKEITNVTQHYMIFDMGTSKTTASVVSFQEVKQKNPATGIAEKFPQLTVKGVGYDRSLGGLEFQLRLRDHLAKNFNAMKKTSTDVFTNKRAMAKLFKEAGRLKYVLSANTYHVAQIENVMEDIDFKFKVTREEFYEMCPDLFDRIKTVIDTAYASSEVTQGEIAEVLLMGAGTRIPEVQARIMAASGKTELGKSLNTDEAAAIGAVYQAAAASKGFKVKKFAVRDAAMFPVQAVFPPSWNVNDEMVEFDRIKADESGEESVKTVKRTLFGRNNPYPQKKVMTFNKHTKDFNFAVNYDLEKLAMGEEELKTFGPLSISNVALSGVESAFQAHVADNAEAKGVKAHFRMDESGVLHVDKVEAIFERPPEADKAAAGGEGEESTLSKLGNTISNFFGSGEKDAAQEGDVKEEEQPGEEAAPEEGEEKAEDKTEKKEEAKEEETADEKKEEETEEKKEQEAEPEKEEKKEEDTKEKEEETKKEEDSKEDKDKKEGDSKEDKDKKDDKEKKEEKKEKKPSKPVTIREDIVAKVDLKDLDVPSADSKKESKQKLRELKKRDEEKLKLEKAQNELESFIIGSQEKLYEDLYQQCSTEAEREDISAKLSAASDWLYEVDETTPRKEYEEKLAELSKLLKPLKERVKEAEDRPRAMEALNSMMNYSEHFLVSMKNFTGEEVGEQPFTTVEYTTLEKLITETKEWNATVQKDQASVAMTEKPILLVEDIARKIQDLDREVKYLVNKAKSFKPKVKKAAKEEKNKTETASDDSSSKSEEEEKVEAPAPASEGGEGEAGEEGVQMDIPPMPGSEEEKNEKKKKEAEEEPEETLQLDGEVPLDDALNSNEQTGEETTHDAGEL